MPRDSAHDIDPNVLLQAYAIGYFPMARGRAEAGVVWVLPDQRGVLDLDAARLPRKLRRQIAQEPFEVRVDSDFVGVMQGCAEATPGREDTWINDVIFDAYAALHRMGRAHSIECWADGALVGGLYGVTLGQIFCGESMFSRRTNASKVALAYLVAHLKRGGFRLLDTQFYTEHLAQFGVEEISAADYQRHLDALSRAPAMIERVHLAAEAVLQSITQTS
ncbi:MAG: leucyl/phenylalanyl-tRNA--protein transferase [Parvularculaceae bacterium]|nr:leucyl/phenylalanyl-tRNA--protein transferase [Parvularculaceae bacterium]